MEYVWHLVSLTEQKPNEPAMQERDEYGAQWKEEFWYKPHAKNPAYKSAKRVHWSKDPNLLNYNLWSSLY